MLRKQETPIPHLEYIVYAGLIISCNKGRRAHEITSRSDIMGLLRQRKAVTKCFFRIVFTYVSLGKLS